MSSKVCVRERAGGGYLMKWNCRVYELAQILMLEGWELGKFIQL